MVVSAFAEAFFEEIVGEYAGLGEAVDATTDLEVHPAVVGYGGEVVFGDELVGNVVDFDADVFIAVEWGAEVEVFDVETGKLAFFLERTLLRTSLISSSELVGVPTSPG